MLVSKVVDQGVVSKVIIFYAAMLGLLSDADLLDMRELIEKVVAAGRPLY